MEILTSNSDTLDLAIIGGGPAGTAAALEGGRLGLRTAIWERDRFPRDKVCGEFISPAALPLLQSEIPGAVARGAEILRAEFVSDKGVSRTFRLPRPALGLSRRVLDRALWKRCETSGIEVHEGVSVRSAQKLGSRDRQAASWEIETLAGNVRKARALIVACGRWWTVRGLLSPTRQLEPPRPGEWVGVKAHFAGVRPRGNVEMYFFHGGYCGLAPVEGDACNVCCLVHREQVRQCRAKAMHDFAAWLVQVSQLAALENRLRGAEQVSAVVTTAPVHLSRRRTKQDGALMVGDASGFLDPFTGEGISMALHSGRLAAQAVAMTSFEGFNSERAAEIYCQSLEEAVSRSYTIAALARGLLQGPAWLRGLVTTPLPWIGKRLVRETRWRGNREATLN
jgi:flavin-dependent dehydrogenase